ncbi:30S ribosomal protein S4 [Candidatus Heimdallarchaeota archaeon B3_Heim]|nr:MAG: 30S ribosomal protein S4 [Candidatus Heimdallarchaeota archaeon B3_Heim]
MGDPRKLRKKLEGPRHPFNKTRIEEEMQYMGRFGLRNKKEIWKAQTILRKYRSRARASLALPESQRETERNNLVKKLFRMGIMANEEGLTDDVLSLNVEQFLKRRLQSIVHELGLANTPWQARQMICHGHIALEGRKVTAPSYHVKRGEEESITFSPSSPYNDSAHPALSVPASRAVRPPPSEEN